MTTGDVAFCRSLRIRFVETHTRVDVMLMMIVVDCALCRRRRRRARMSAAAHSINGPSVGFVRFAQAQALGARLHARR